MFLVFYLNFKKLDQINAAWGHHFICKKMFFILHLFIYITLVLYTQAAQYAVRVEELESSESLKNFWPRPLFCLNKSKRKKRHSSRVRVCRVWGHMWPQESSVSAETPLWSPLSTFSFFHSCIWAGRSLFLLSAPIFTVCWGGVLSACSWSCRGLEENCSSFLNLGFQLYCQMLLYGIYLPFFFFFKLQNNEADYGSTSPVCWFELLLMVLSWTKSRLWCLKLVSSDLCELIFKWGRFKVLFLNFLWFLQEKKYIKNPPCVF